MKTFVIGDIHGAYKALIECLALSCFDKSQDMLICLGDVCDRGAQVKECINELLTIVHCIYILGNHDVWALDWMNTGNVAPEWKTQGGAQTIRSYKNGEVPQEHIRFLSDAYLYFIDHNRLFVHAGFNPTFPIEKNTHEMLLWDRRFIQKAREENVFHPHYQFPPYNEIYIGHTPTITMGSKEPKKYCNVWAMDTGAGWGGKLTIMDVDTKQFWQANVE